MTFSVEWAFKTNYLSIYLCLCWSNVVTQYVHCLLCFRHELPPDQYQSLKEQLLDRIGHFAGGAKIVLTRLCIVVSDR